MRSLKPSETGKKLIRDLHLPRQVYPDKARKVFVRLMLQGKVSALRWLDTYCRSSPHTLTDSVIDKLKGKYKKSQASNEKDLLNGPIPPIKWNK